MSVAEDASAIELIRRLSRLIAIERQQDFGPAILDFIGSLAPFDCALIVIYRANNAPLLIHDALAHPQRQNNTRHYLESAYLLDPFAKLATGIDRPQLLRLRDIAAHHEAMSAYTELYYQASYVADEVNYVIPLHHGRALAICIEKVVGNGLFSDLCVRRLNLALTPITALATRLFHHDFNSNHTDHAAHGRLRERLAAFGCDLLSSREQEIALGLLAGLTVEQLGDRYGISRETCRTHRRNIYRKFGISSLGELFSMALLWIERQG